MPSTVVLLTLPEASERPVSPRLLSPAIWFRLCPPSGDTVVNPAVAILVARARTDDRLPRSFKVSPILPPLMVSDSQRSWKWRYTTLGKLPEPKLTLEFY